MDNIRLNICIVFIDMILLTSISIHSLAQEIESPKIGYNTINRDHNAVEMNERQIEFAGLRWGVKSGEHLGPGPNHWSDSEESVWVDPNNGMLHLKIREVNGTWYCAEVYTKEFALYGMQRFYVISRLDSLDKNVVVGLFLYKNDSLEIDIEFAKWGWENLYNTWYVVQPPEIGNVDSFAMALNGTYTTHYINWHPESVQFKSIHGHREEPHLPGHLIHEWVYKGKNIPVEKDSLRIHMNLWLFKGQPPSNGKEEEIIISSPNLTVTSVEELKIAVPQGFELFQNHPNPFNAETRIKYEISKSTKVTIKIFNILGEEVSILVDEIKEPGSHIINWDGKNKCGGYLSSGIYIYRIQAANFSQSKKIILIR